MPCALLTLRHTAGQFLIWLALPLAAVAQSPPPVPPLPYRAPSIALAQPVEGGTVPQDRPTLVFRFAPADASDPLDLGSLRVSTDARDVTAAFRVTPNEAWGQLAAAPGGTATTPGAHSVTARICSLRGACGTVTATISVIAVVPAGDTPNDSRASSGPRGLIGALVKLGRKLIGP